MEPDTLQQSSYKYQSVDDNDINSKKGFKPFSFIV